jgi:hypothetical protein
MKFTLISATTERVREFEKLSESPERQSCSDFEAHLVDRNSDVRISPFIERFGDCLEQDRPPSDGGIAHARAMLAKFAAEESLRARHSRSHGFRNCSGLSSPHDPKRITSRLGASQRMKKVSQESPTLSAASVARARIVTRKTSGGTARAGITP